MTFCWNSAVAVPGGADSAMRNNGAAGYAGFRNAGFKMPGCRKLVVGGDDAITKEVNPLMVTAEHVDRMSKRDSRSSSAPDTLIRSNLNLPG